MRHCVSPLCRTETGRISRFATISLFSTTTRGSADAATLPVFSSSRVPGPFLLLASVFFLQSGNSPAGITHLVGLTQGVFDVRQQADGSVSVSRAAAGETLLDASGRAVRDFPLQMKLATLRARVSQTVAARVRE